MIERVKDTVESEIEKRKLEVLIEQNKEELGNFEIIPVSDKGFLVQSERFHPMAGNDWLMSDLDDVWVAYSESKNERLASYKKLLNEDLSIEAGDQDAERLIDLTDQFSRWEDNGRDMYHANAHMSALSWATDNLKNLSPEEIKAKISEIEGRLEKIKNELSNPDAAASVDDPFYFKEGTLILRNKKPWSPNIESVFQSIINPARYNDSIESTREVGQPPESIHRINVGVFTYGDPYFQLLKTIEILKEYQQAGKEIPISQIWLSKEAKGQFIEDLVKTDSEANVKLDYVPARMEDTQGEGMAYGSGYPLGKHPHVFVMLDDNPKELNSVLSANDYLKENSGATFITVRSIRSGTKTENQRWNVSSKYGEVDFRSTTNIDIPALVNINRFLEIKKRLEAASPNEIPVFEKKLEEIKADLIRQRVNIEELAG